MRKHPPQLPSLVYDFRHALIDRVMIGAHGEVTLFVSPLVWDGPNGRRGEPVPVRFTGIKNFDEVCNFFGGAENEQFELAWLRYMEQPRSKPGSLYFVLELERTNGRLVLQCSNLQVGSPNERTPVNRGEAT